MPIKIAFVSPHCLLDYTNGAATATRDGLRVLIEQGFECQAFCGTRLDEPQEGLLQESLFRRGVRYEVHNANIGPYQGRLLFTVDGNLPVTVFENVSTTAQARSRKSRSWSSWGARFTTPSGG